MNETSIIAIILSLIAVGGTLIGTWLGRLLERSNEIQKWRREHCLEAYTEIFSACHIVLFESDKAYGIECGSLEHNIQAEIVLDKVSEMHHLTDKVVLIASRDVYLKLLDLTTFCGTEIGAKSVKCPKISETEWNRIRSEFATLFGDSRNTARNDLKIHPKLFKKQNLNLK